MSVRDFLQNCLRLLKLATRPGRREIWLLARIVFAGVFIIGTLGFIVRLISALWQGFVPY